MEITPNLDSFSKVYDLGKNYLVYTRLSADLDTTVSLMLKLTEAKKNSFMLESVTGGDSKGRYSIIGMNPDLIWRCDGENASLNRLALNDSENYKTDPEDPLTSLRNILEESSIDLPDSLPPMAAGLFGYLGYDMIRLVEHLPNINDAKNYIKSGDIFQVVPSQRWTVEFPLPPFSLYRALRRTNPSPYMFYFNFGNFQVTGASPEILVRVKEDEVTIRPIAGTRPRGQTVDEDKELELDLLADKKELAEHLMLLDLGRNDVGRVAKIGTVTPNEKFVIERYSHVMHIVSNVIGKLSTENDALSALLAGLPAGTVSGAPKVRAMEIIDELEVEKRGVYGGGVGYFSSNGDMDICIALRTAVTKNKKLYIQAGGGVVFDSDPEAEFQETVNKSKALQTAAKIAGQYI